MAEQIKKNARNREQAKDFLLGDQFGNTHEFKFPTGQVTVFGFGDREGSEQLEEWIRPIYEKYGDKIYIHGIAELSAVPLLARFIAHEIIRSRTIHSVMLDWEGNVSESFKYEKNKANIVVIDKKGFIAARKVGEADAEKLDAIYKAIDRLLK